MRQTAWTRRPMGDRGAPTAVRRAAAADRRDIAGTLPYPPEGFGTITASPDEAVLLDEATTGGQCRLRTACDSTEQRGGFFSQLLHACLHIGASGAEAQYTDAAEESGAGH